MSRAAQPVVPATRTTRPRLPWRLSPKLSPRRLVLLLVLAGVLWRTVRYALGFPFWGDESFVAVNFAARDFAGMVQPLLYGQIAPLAFMWAELAVSRLLGWSEWALRLLPFLAGVAALLLFARFAWQVLPRRAAVLATGFFAAAMYIVRHGAEVKPYSLDLLVSLGLTMLAWSIWRRPYSLRRWTALLILAAAAPWCSYPSAFTAGAVGIFLTLLVFRPLRHADRPLHSERPLRHSERSEESSPGARNPSTPHARPLLLSAWLLYGLVLLASFAAMYTLYAKPHAAAAAGLKEIPMWTLAFPPLDRPLRFLVWLGAIHTSEMFAYPHGGKPPGSIVTFILFLFGVARLWRRNRPLLLLLLAPFPLTFIAAALHAYPYGGSARTSLYLAPAICLLAGLGLDAAFWWTLRFLAARRQFAAFDWLIARARHVFALTCLGLGVFAVAGAISDVAQPYQSKASLRSKQAVVAVRKQSQPGDRWITFNADRPTDFAPYLGDWRGVGGQFVFDVVRFAPGPLTWAPPPETVTPPENGAAPSDASTWLLVYRVESEKVDFPDNQFAAYLAVLTARLGEPEQLSYPVKEERSKREWIEAYRFP